MNMFVIAVIRTHQPNHCILRFRMNSTRTRSYDFLKLRDQYLAMVDCQRLNNLTHIAWIPPEFANSKTSLAGNNEGRFANCRRNGVRLWSRSLERSPNLSL